MSQILNRKNQQLLGFYAGVGEELTLYFDDVKTEFYVEHLGAPSGCWELYRGKNGIAANQAFQIKLQEILQSVIEEYQSINKVKEEVKSDVRRLTIPGN